MNDSALKAVRVEHLADSGGCESVGARISAVIPVLNGGRRLGQLLEKLKQQKKVRDVEIIVLDSGSTDGSTDTARAAGARVIEIPKGTFSHGGTRQLGAEQAKGEYLLFTVQDAVPATDYLLFRMTRIMEQHSELMVLSGRQVVNGEADLYSRWSITTMYSALQLSKDMKYSLRCPDLFDELPETSKRSLSFVDDVCACYRASAVRKYGFARIENAEDIEIGIRLLKGGHSLGFLYTTGVYHWHNSPADYFLKRHFVGVKSMVEILGRGLPDLGSLKITSLADVTRTCVNLYETVRTSIDGLEGDESLSPRDISDFVSRLNAAFQGLAETDRHKAVGSAAIERVLVSVGAKYEESQDLALIRSNPLLVPFFGQMRSLVNFVAATQALAPVAKYDFADAIYKITGALIGEILGQWYMKLVTEGRQSEMELVRDLLFKGICSN